MVIQYYIGVKTPAGWREEQVTARVEPSATGKKATVVEVLDVGGNGVAGYAGRTGAKRQTYSVSYFAKNEMGKTKILSKVKILEEEKTHVTE